jgi:ABC-type transport system involved in resistance to organic solvents, permease component
MYNIESQILKLLHIFLTFNAQKRLLIMLKRLGNYLLLIVEAFKRPIKWPMFRRQLLKEFGDLGLDSFAIVAILSVFIGAVASILTAYNIDTPFVPKTMVAFTARQIIILEFSPTIISLILAGKLGSQIASELGTMRVTQQIDALYVMGVNPVNYLVLPKIIACVLFNPVLITFSIVLGLLGAWTACVVTDIISSDAFLVGLLDWFDPFTVSFAMIKTVTFAFIISSVSSFVGYNVAGGSVEVGKASTRAVVVSSILIILFDLVLTQIFLT